MKLPNIKIIMWLIVIFCICSCKKYLDEKSNKQLSTPDTVEDLQALLDNQPIYFQSAGTSQICDDEYFVPFSVWQTTFPDAKKLAYIWDAQLDYEQDWNQQYSYVLIANTVLDRVDQVTTGQRADEIKGSALFLRAHCFYQLAQLFAPQYDPATAGIDLGIVLRLEADFTLPSDRSSIKETYDQIISDLQQAVTLLPNVTTVNLRPSKAAGYALLARVYLQMGDYQKAKDAADQSIGLYNFLIDYNNSAEVNPVANNSIVNLGILNKEILFYQGDQASYKISSTTRIDSAVYSLYDTTDVRKTAFFIQNTGENTFRFKGSYVAPRQFIGLGTSEVYLIRAEANARLGNISPCVQDLTTLLNKRYKTGKVPILNPTTNDQALALVLVERRREMLYRGMRWADLKRLNKNSATAVTIRRNLNGIFYSLPPNDLRYTLLIPLRVIQLSNLQQNSR